MSQSPAFTDQEPRVAQAVLEYARPQSLPPFRRVICGLLFFATTINYTDRQVIGVLKPVSTDWAGRWLYLLNLR